MAPKILPSFDGQSSWFEFEDLIDDGVNITTLSAEKLGPSRKKMLDNDSMSSFERRGTALRTSRRHCAPALSKEQTMFFS